MKRYLILLSLLIASLAFMGADVSHYYGASVPSQPLKTGQTTSYHAGDDGDLEKGVARSYNILTTGQHSGTTNITINGKTHALSNNCVIDERTGLMWARYVPDADIGPGNNGELFWDQWTLTDKVDISFDNASGEIRSGASQFDTGALCAGRKFTVTGSTSNDGTYTVSSITTAAITTVEGVADEAAGDTISVATVDDLIWDYSDQANANSLGGYDDWRIPTYIALQTIVDNGTYSPCINVTAFPSAPASFHWTSTIAPDSAGTYAYVVNFYGGMAYQSPISKHRRYVRLVRDN